MLVLAHDWIGPKGPWPNGQNLDLLTSPKKYEKSNYSVANKHVYGLEDYRHPYTYSKLGSVIGKNFVRKHITECTGKFIYELTPLLKPYQWVDNAFDHVSNLAIEKQQQGQCLFVINDMNEGYSNERYNFFEHLHKQVDKHNLLHKNIVYLTLNAVLPKEYDKWCAVNKITKKIKIHCVYIFESLENKNKITCPNKHYICLNRQPNPYRQCLVYELWRRDLLKYGHVSMPDPSITMDFTFDKSNLKLFNLDDSRWEEFLETLPYEVDGRDFTSQSCSFNTIDEFYQDSVYAIITENTFGADDCIKITEKSFNAFDNYCMPLYFYNSKITTELLEIGYTVDTSIDNVSEEAKKFFALVDRIEEICSLSINDVHNSTSDARIKNYKNLKRRSKVKKQNHLRIFEKWHES